MNLLLCRDAIFQTDCSPTIGRVRIVRVIEAQTMVLHLNHTNDHVERHTKKNGNPVLG